MTVCSDRINQENFIMIMISFSKFVSMIHNLSIFFFCINWGLQTMETYKFPFENYVFNRLYYKRKTWRYNLILIRQNTDDLRF
jgi:hypothetical protein